MPLGFPIKMSIRDALSQLCDLVVETGSRRIQALAFDADAVRIPTHGIAVDGAWVWIVITNAHVFVRCVAAREHRVRIHAPGAEVLVATVASYVPNTPIVLFKGDTFLILYNGTLDLLTSIPLRTLETFSEDVHGSGHGILDTENLSSSEFCAFVKILAACIEGETIKEQACEKAKSELSSSRREGSPN